MQSDREVVMCSRIRGEFVRESGLEMLAIAVVALTAEVDPKGWTNLGRRLDGAAG
jgi:hypothetical protein